MPRPLAFRCRLPTADTGLLRIDYLADHPDWVPLVAGWKYREWGGLYPRPLVQRLMPWRTPGDWIAGTRASGGRGALPVSFVACAGDRPVGTAALVARDDSEEPSENAAREEYSPWLSGVFVVPRFRRQGTGSALVRRVEEEALSLGCRQLYLQTFDRVDFYRRLGWVVIGAGGFQQRPVQIMRRTLW